MPKTEVLPNTEDEPIADEPIETLGSYIDAVRGYAEGRCFAVLPKVRMS